MATTRATFGSVLSVVTSTAGAAVSLLDNINSGLEMLSIEINDAKAAQRLGSIRSNALLVKSQGLLFAQESCSINEELSKLCAKSTDHANWADAALQQWNQLTTAK